jgi:hypothetical protein
MKKVFTLVIIATVVLLSCSKKNNDPIPLNLKSADSTVTIGGDVYPVVKIGTQTWTSVNYRGPGGIFNTGYMDTYNVQHGKLYTPQEANQIILPAKWRLPTYDDYLN